MPSKLIKNFNKSLLEVSGEGYCILYTILRDRHLYVFFTPYDLPFLVKRRHYLQQIPE